MTQKVEQMARAGAHFGAGPMRQALAKTGNTPWQILFCP